VPAGIPDQPPSAPSSSTRRRSRPNNVAEWRAIIAALEAARGFPARSIEIRADSQLVVRQLEGRYRVKQAHLKPLHEQARALLDGYDDVTFVHVPRDDNVVADALVNAALDA
jgi:ribonuclease HI